MDNIAQRIDTRGGSTKLVVLSLALLGLLKLARGGLYTCQSMMKYFVLPRRDLQGRYGKGSWALVTGASDGIGKQYAMELAREGFNIVLMGRNADKTKATAEEVQRATEVQTKVVIVDFATLETEQDVLKLQKALQSVSNLDVSILVNNVGVIVFGRFGDSELSSINTTINVNVNAMTYLSIVILPKLAARKPRSAVINLASRSSLVSVGSKTLYCATKRYNLALSKCMEDAYSDKIDVLTVTPYMTSTQMCPIPGPFNISPETHCKAAINQLGWQSQTWGSPLHAFEWWMEKSGPLAPILGPYLSYRAAQDDQARQLYFRTKEPGKS